MAHVGSVECTVPGLGLALRGERYAPAAPSAKTDEGRWLLLHGWLDNADSFSQLAPRLCAADAAIFGDVVALDMAGHGLSDHRKAPYHVVDFAAEAVAVADELWGKGCRFSVLGHSLGGGVALLVAGGWPDRIIRVAAVESAGALAARAEDAPTSLNKACRRVPSGKSAVFADAAAAAERRATKNVIPDKSFTVVEAAILAKRGLRREGDGVTWRTDPWLLAPSRLRLEREQALAFAAATTAPALVVVARDGAFCRGRRFDPFARATVFLTRLASAALRFAGRVLPLPRALRTARDDFGTLNDMGRRVRALAKGTTAILPTGGHHCHMTEPDAVAAQIVAWARRPDDDASASGETSTR
mmetsp:Transcript_16581/g.49950  ORF Transcript_16581/g.49950 Transcript_16581/m.49950 type:complete len:358 (-) Transcript_16581:54-1127(-)